MHRISLILFCTLPFLLLAQEKSLYDLAYRGLNKPAEIAGVISPDYLLANSAFIEISLSKQGYFTIGTLDGMTDSNMDDDCQITFGHPYAMTSYPVFALDGDWYNFSDYFSLPDSLYLNKEAGTLMFTGTEQNSLQISFSLVAKTEHAAVEFILKITNTDTVTHTLAPGFVFDPALGKWGDGIFLNGSTTCLRDTVFSSGQIASPLQIWEKNSGAKGIGSKITFTSPKPEKIILANWHDVYNDFTPDFEQSGLRDLYDLVVKIYWATAQLAPGAQHEVRWELSLVEPDFSSKAFTRWDVPSYLSMDSGVMFPGKMKTTLEVTNTTDLPLQNAQLNLALPQSITSGYDTYDLNLDSKSRVYQPIDLNAKLIYEDKIVDISANFYENDILLESFKRKVFIPATPVSDTGLVVVNDSISLANFPEVDIVFSVEKEATGQRVFDLSSENIFLFENNLRIQNFSLEKFSGDGSNLVDIVFVLDISGSMGNEKDQVVAYLGEFADSLLIRGFDFKIGLVTFSTTIDRIVDLTNDVDYVKQVLSSISLWGGVEDSPLALYSASALSFREGSRRNIIWITDEPYPEESYTAEQIVNRMLSMDITVHGVGLLSLETDWFNPIVIPTGGKFYDISGNFRDILLDVSRFEAQDRFILKYTTNKLPEETIALRMEIHYAGLGVIKAYSISAQTKIQTMNKLLCYPNPFNPEITLQIYKTPDTFGDIVIFNILGQQVQKFDVPQKGIHAIIWDGHNPLGIQVGSGFYIVQLTLHNTQGISHQESTRILYLK